MAVIAGLDTKIPVTLFPVRIETRFAGPSAAPKLLVRLYPDDIHIDHHDALLRDDLADGESSRSWAAQSPAAPYRDDVDAALTSSWVGLPHPAALGPAPVVCAVIIGDDATGALTGVELDAWTEVLPNETGTAAVAANLSAPDARAPNVILMAMPPDVEQPWTEESLLSVVDEALELAECRLVDLDATRRVPALLPACYLAEYDENDLAVRRFLTDARTFPSRWVAGGGA